MSNQKVYQQLVNERDGGPRHIVCTPRDPSQVKDFRKELNRQIRISHDAMFNTYQLCFQLQFNDRRGVPQDFIRLLQVFPTVIGHLILQPLLESLEALLKVFTGPVILHYDTVFNMGDFYISTLTCISTVHVCNYSSGIFYPLPSLSRRSHAVCKSDKEITTFACSKKIIMVTDREFDFSEIFPLIVIMHFAGTI